MVPEASSPKYPQLRPNMPVWGRSDPCLLRPAIAQARGCGRQAVCWAVPQDGLVFIRTCAC